MALMSEARRHEARSFHDLAYCNPFLPERIELERAILGDGFIPTGSAWHKEGDEGTPASPNLLRLMDRAQALVDTLRERVMNGASADDQDLALYERVVLYLIYERYQTFFFAMISRPGHTGEPVSGPVAFYDRFKRDLEFYLSIPDRTLPSLKESAHLFACAFQVRRAFHHIFDYVIGGSAAITRLRAGIWQSIFTHDMARYRREVYRHMGDITTLVTGPSGTGKELVARAIGLSRYVPFDPAARTFADDPAGSFHAVNLSALSTTLIESELFGHRKGAFTGAVKDHTGWFEVCPPLGAVFLDEIGELEASIQVKLLRVLETRTFQRIGETEPRSFRGKIVAATNRDPHEEMQAGRLRADFYYRLCSDVVRTPSLREQLVSSDGEHSIERMHGLVLHIAKRVAGAEEASVLAEQVELWIQDNMDPDYAWPGNVRELEQCVRNVLIRRAYHPAGGVSTDAARVLMDEMNGGYITADDLIRHYCTLTYARTGTYQETARRLGLDHRTVKSKIDSALLEQYQGLRNVSPA